MSEVSVDLPQAVPVSGIWLRRIGDEVHVLAEVDEKWRTVIVEKLVSDPEADGLGSVSHIVEVAGIISAPADESLS